ncbi:MAG: alpha/beta fold hydrolase [Candidatus Heimdallarchaeota archaeon]|nr:alpha/beta fold hydrolase [Candidatus Heimdallarchaeota archaeon]
MSKEERTAFLLIHGFTGTHYEMEPLAKHLRNKEIYVENIVLPGHETSVEDLKDRKWYELTNYAQEQLNILKQNFESVYVCGLSLGGAITLHLGANNPDIEGIIALAAPAFSPDWRMWLLAYLPFVHLLYPFHGNEEKGWEDNDSLKTHQSYGVYPIKTVSQLFKLFKINKKKMQDIEIPILIVYSKNDPTISLKHAEKIYYSVSSKDKKILQIQRGGHVIPKDAGRKQLFEEIDVWLEERTK